jgi:sulfur transfer complex TusBCD TusB component (DsrH family)
MTLRDLLTETRNAGIQLEARGDRLHVEAPAGAVTPELRAALVAHKPDLLAVLAPSRGFVTLKNGPTLPVEPFALAIDLEARGIVLHTDANHQVLIPNDSRLTEADRAALDRWRQHLGAIVEYHAPELS